MATVLPPTEVEPLVSVEEYLNSSYEPDCEYVNGHLEERNVGEFDHGHLQALLATIFTVNREAWGVRAVTDVRTQTKVKNFRIPDLAIVRIGAPKERIFRHPPLLAIEILSPEDRMSRVQVRVNEMLDFGIEHIWIIDPETREAWTATKSGFLRAENGELSILGTAIRVVLTDLFAELDRA